ncbi:MAG: hypothetical protein WCH39_13245 [Schlesneria sp.]
MTECDSITVAKIVPSNKGRVIGLVLGSAISIALISFQHHELYHARLYVDVARVMATHDARKGVERLEEFGRRFTADRFIEKSHMLVVPAKLRMSGAAALKDKKLLEQAAAELSAQLGRLQQTVDGRRNEIVSPSGLIYPFSWDSQGTIRTAIVCEKWDEANQLADTGLKKAEEFWQDIGGTPMDPAQVMNPNSKVTVADLKNIERNFLACRAWVRARTESYEFALKDIQKLLDEPLDWQTPQTYIVPEILLLRAAVQYQLGQTELSAETYADAIRSTIEPVEFGPAKTLQIPHGWRLKVERFMSVETSWDLFRAGNFGIPNWWASPKPKNFFHMTTTLTLRDNHYDLVDEMIRARQIQIDREILP